MSKDFNEYSPEAPPSGKLNFDPIQMRIKKLVASKNLLQDHTGDPYDIGVANGMEFAVAIMEDREAKLSNREAPPSTGTGTDGYCPHGFISGKCLECSEQAPHSVERKQSEYNVKEANSAIISIGAYLARDMGWEDDLNEAQVERWRDNAMRLLSLAQGAIKAIRFYEAPPSEKGDMKLLTEVIEQAHEHLPLGLKNRITARLKAK